MNKYLTIISVLCLQLIALGAGFGLNEMSARGNALQGALVGSTRDVSAVVYNPANVTELAQGTHTMLGVTFARPDYDTHVLGITTDQDERIFMLPHLYLATSLADNLYLGFGEYTEFGLGTIYENPMTWPLAAGSSKTLMYSYTLSPTISYRINEQFAIGGGARIMYLNLINDRLIPAYQSKFHMDVDDWDLTYLLSCTYKPTSTLSIGLVYRAQADFCEEGDVSLSPVGLRTTVWGDISMPQSLNIGINWNATEKLMLGANFTYTDWSVIKSLDMHFASPALPDQYAPHKWHDTIRASLGAEYTISDALAIQCGITHDLDPTDAGYANVMCPPGDRDQIGLGMTYSLANWTFALDYMLVIIHETDRTISTLPTSFRDLRTDTFGLSISHKF